MRSGLSIILSVDGILKKSLDPVYMDETTPEEDWFAFIRDDLRWRVKRSDIDDDIYIDPNQIIHGMPGVIG